MLIDEVDEYAVGVRLAYDAKGSRRVPTNADRIEGLERALKKKKRKK